MNSQKASTAAVILNQFSFGFENSPLLFREISLSIPTGSRTLLIGANGVGKSTLLRILAGLHIVSRHSVQVLGYSPFHDMEPSASPVWIGGDLQFDLDIAVRELFPQNNHPEQKAREHELLKLFGISLDWRMHRVSEGQKRRVQLFLALRHPAPFFLLDEVTAHLDVTMRSDFLDWTRKQGSTTFAYATHIFDGLLSPRGDFWPTHVLWLGFSGKYCFTPLSRLKDEIGKSGSLGFLCEKWIRENLADFIE